MKPFLSILAIMFASVCFAQQAKTDKIYLNDGTILEVNVRKVTAAVIEYSYPGEAAQNEERVEQVRSIVFASGRVQQFNTGSAAANSVSAPTTAEVAYREVQPNSMAILPVAFYDKRSGKLWEDHAKLAQSRIYDFFEDDASKIAPLKMQDTRTTNSHLRKANIDYDRLDETPVDELSRILGAEYLVLSKVTCETRAKSTLNETTYGGTEKKGNRQVAAVRTTSTVNEERTYHYVVVLEIYKGGQKIYNETRKPMLNMEDSWKDAMAYMLKRAPIYKRK